MSWWIATHYPPPIGLTECVWVEADSEGEAAQKAVDAFESEDGRMLLDPQGEVGAVEHVFLVPADDYKTYVTRLTVEPCAPEFACCGGPIQYTKDGHSGYCPVHRDVSVSTAEPIEPRAND